MDNQKVDMYIMQNAKFFPEEQIGYIKERLLATDDGKFAMISGAEMKDPMTMLLVSIFLGSLGVDRFMMGDTGMGVLKLLTCGCCGVLTIIDWFSIQRRAREANFSKLQSLM